MDEFIPAPIKPVVRIATVDALDIRVGTIESVEEIPRSEKLMKLNSLGRESFARQERELKVVFGW